LDSDNAAFDADLYCRVMDCQSPPKVLYKAIKLTVCAVRLCASKSSFAFTHVEHRVQRVPTPGWSANGNCKLSDNSKVARHPCQVSFVSLTCSRTSSGRWPKRRAPGTVRGVRRSWPRYGRLLAERRENQGGEVM